jgi:hypothetical protein
VTGVSNHSGTAYDFTTIKYNSSGMEDWIAIYDGPGNAFDYPAGIAVDDFSNVYVTGQSWGTYAGDHWSFFTSIKYVQTSVSVKEQEIISPARYSLSQNYPNPFNPSTIIRYSLPKPGHVMLKIFDLLGREVATLVNDMKAAGEYDVQWTPSGLTSGVYVYRLQAGDFVDTKKLVLLQ